ncbi:HAMP domain-containing sensor histidine kinase [Winogradskya humida]|uniref:histidine kinase n=1 Tax=Winogradskya humida TaxID=113566 RepID=A0ABQ3ZZ40_9ACTN|nr:HAMP domain-containing sensor histidine kinase [Actinoplanes humidus]GIE23678.1 two-component sensor histidine kinase [Actinoplanes humidus]
MTGDRPHHVPLHRSLVGRLLATSVLIALAAVVATAWLATQTTSRAIRQEQGRSLAEDTSVYDMLIGYAAVHRDWTGVQGLVEDRAADIGRRITVTTEDRELIADSGSWVPPGARRASALVDPLRLDQGLTAGTDRIDARVRGPYRLTAKEHAELRRFAEEQLRCLEDIGLKGILGDGPDGRPTVRVTVADSHGMAGLCAAKTRAVTTTEKVALEDLAARTARCLGLTGRDEIAVGRDFTVESVRRSRSDRTVDVSDSRTTSCVREARVQQLRPYVAPPALLFITDADNAVNEPVFSLSRANILRIVWVTAAVLLATIVLTVLTGRRLVQPLRALTGAAAQPLSRSVPMPVTRNDEIGYLARTLNDLGERRERAEAQRRLMVSDIAHELRNPLTNIRAWLEVAQDGVVPAEPALLDLLQDEAIVLQHIIDDLSDLAAADAGNLRLHPEPVAVRDVVNQVTDSHGSVAAQGRVTLTSRVPGNPVINADPVRLRQIVGNLVSNAIRYTPPEGTVSVTAEVTGTELTIVVRDTGTGIAPGDLPKIFDRFWRADTSRARATGGSGLGLPIARQLAEAHGGTLTARSSPGGGTTMSLRLPLTP